MISVEDYTQRDDADPEDEAPGAAATPLRFIVATEEDGLRIDKALALRMPATSRSRLQGWIEAGAVRLNGVAVKPRQTIHAGDAVEVEPQAAPEDLAYTPEPMALAIVHEDDSILVLDKPPGLVVHPAAGHWSGTLLNGLLAHRPALARVPRAGIVHRLDAHTSGLMVVALTVDAQLDLVRQLQARSVRREYWALVHGTPPPRGSIEGAIERDPRNPLRFRVGRGPAAKPARTHYARIAQAEVDDACISWIACRLETGRTHQIRVHLESIGHPLLGDPVYRGRRPGVRLAADAPAWQRFERQALHACRLGLRHPATAQPMEWFRAPPPDMAELMQALGFGPTDRPREARFPE